MREFPKVSVIIPLYNREKYIAETVRSVLNQTYPNIELIVVDDGSTDGSRAALQPYASRLTLLEQPGRANKGQSAAINLGLRHAAGKYIAILDSDDLFLPEKLKAQVDYLEQNPEVGLVYSNGFIIDSNGKRLYKFYSKPPDEKSEPSNVLLDCYFPLPSNSLVRSEVFQKTGPFDEKLRSGQDHDMAIRVAEVSKLAYIDDTLFCYRKHADSISVKRADLRWNNGFIILNKAKKRFHYPAATIRKRRAVLYFRLGQIYLEKKCYFNSTVHFLLSGLLDPVRGIGVLTGREGTGGLH